jgi:predicted benzoate:H+ symporter BenE
VNDAQKRALRTLIQAIIGALSAGLLDLVGIVPGNWVPVLAVVLTTTLAAVQNALEDNGTIRSTFK